MLPECELNTESGQPLIGKIAEKLLLEYSNKPQYIYLLFKVLKR